MKWFRKVRKNVKKQFNIFRKWYLKNSNITFPITGVMALLLVFACFSIFNTFSKTGYNQNVVNGDDGITSTDVFYDKLVSVEQTTYDYVPYDENDTLTGSGSENDPYIIDNGHDLDRIREETNLLNYTYTFWNGTFYVKQVANIDMENRDFVPIVQARSNYQINFDGDFYHIKNLKPVYIRPQSVNVSGQTVNCNVQGLFGVIQSNSVIKNVVLDDLNMTVTNPVNGNYELFAGGLIGLLTGDAKVYNIAINSGSVTTSNLNRSNYPAEIGTMVGEMSQRSVLVNSYSAANLSCPNIGENRQASFGGVVGNRSTNGALRRGNNVIIYLVNYYGRINIPNLSSPWGRGTYQFVYNAAGGGSENDGKIKTRETNSYTYYLWRGDGRDSNGYTTPNTNSDDQYTFSIAKSYDEMSNDGFKTHLNNYRFMAAYYLGIDNNYHQNETSGYPELATWYTSSSDKIGELVLPRLKKYAPISTDKYTQYYATSAGGTCSSGYLKVDLQNSSQVADIRYYCVKITDKDPANGDYVNHKIVLPFNSKTANFSYQGDQSTYRRTLTGWKLTEVKYAGGSVSEKVNGSRINYDYVRRDTEAAGKDIGTVYAQGGYYLVPDGVNEIRVTTQWAVTFYVGDDYNDVIYNNVYRKDNDVSNNRYGTRNYGGCGGATRGTRATCPLSSIQDAQNLVVSSGFAGLTNTEVAFVLVNNLHISTETNYTPYHVNEQKTNLWWPLGTWKNNEVTYMSMDRDGDLSPDYSIYLASGDETNLLGLRLDFVNVLEQPQSGNVNSGLNIWKISTNQSAYYNNRASFEITETVVTDKVTIRLSDSTGARINGGYVNVENKYEATASDNKMSNIYFGGNAKADFVNFGQEATTALSDNPSQRMPVFNIAGGRIGTLSSTYKNADISASSRVYFYVDGGYIGNFYTTYNGKLQKDATVRINGSYINNYYAGGHTASSEVVGGVNTTISNSIIDYVYGGPEYGSISNHSVLNIYNSNINYLYGGGYGGTQVTETNLETSNTASYPYALRTKYQAGKNSNKGYGILTNYDAFVYSKTADVKSAYSEFYSELSVAEVDRVTINLKGGRINKQLYGGGNKGSVTKSVTVNIDGTTIGSPTKNAEVYGGGRTNENETTYVCETAQGSSTPSFKSFFIDSEAKCPNGSYVKYTWANGSVSGNRFNSNSKTLNTNRLNDLGVVKGEIFMNIGNATIYGNVYGGGNMASTEADIHMNLYGTTTITGDIYGGGNKAGVTGDTDVRVQGGEYGSVFAGGNEGEIDGEATATISNGSVVENAYGGGNKTSATETALYIMDGEVENAYGGSNSAGEIERARVYAGKENTKVQKFAPTINDHVNVTNDDPFQEVIDVTGHPNLTTGGYCTSRDIQFEYEDPTLQQWGDNSPYKFTLKIKNTYNYNITINDFKLVIGNGRTIETWGSFRYNNYRVVDGTGYIDVYLNNNNQSIGGGQTLSLEAQQSYPHTHDDAQWFESIYIHATDGKTTYCQATNPNPSSGGGGSSIALTDNRFNYTYPSAATLGTVNITNLYGGNNAGGKTIDSHIELYSDDVTVENVFGGGNYAETTNAVILLERGTVGNVYGGGNNGIMTGNTSVTLNGVQATDSVYGGGKGSEATLFGQSSVTIKGNTEIGSSVFGGGDAANTGVEASNNSRPTVNILGGTIHGNVYGGGNTAQIFGYGDVNIGDSRDNIDGRAPIVIEGSVFGGGESNAAGNKTYDYTYNSVTQGITIDIIGTDANPVTIGGSIFGSGNAANSGGFSHINITKLGTRDNPNFMASIQRADDVNIIDSTIVLAGATDSPNEFNYYNYSISRVQQLTIANNTTLYLEHDFNLVQQFDSMYINGASKVKAAVTIDEDGNFTRNTDNRLYSCAKKSNSVNIRDTESEVNATYQDVNGMTYFGLYIANADHEITEGIYDSSVNNGDVVPENVANLFKAGSYVRAAHKANHDKTIDGFYSNFADPETFKITTKYVPVTSEETPYYEWAIGEQTTDFDIDLIASKYATTGTGSLELSDYSAPNTYFQIIDFGGAALKDGVTLVDSNTIPRIAANSNEAVSKFGLKMMSNSDSWITDGTSEFFYNGTQSRYTGTNKYVTDNSSNIASLDFYLAHSRNIDVQQDLGTAVICIIAYVPVDELSYALTRININVNISTRVEDADGYEGVMTAGRKTELFVNGNTNISNKSQLSAYYSLFMDGNVYQDGGYRYLESTYKLPVNTRITFIDRSVEEKPVYYYYVVTEENYENLPWDYNIYTKTNSRAKFYRYYLSEFVRMGSLSGDNKYDDTVANSSNYYSDLNVSAEEYIFTFDFSEASITESVGSAEIFLTYQKEDSRQTQLSTFRAGNNNTLYNVIAGGDAQLQLTLPEGNNVAYVGQDLDLSTNIKYVESLIGGRRVADTQFTQDKLGLKITLYNSDGNVVTGTSLLGTVFYINNTAYSANLDGSVRLKVADNVASINTVVNIDLSKSTLPTDYYRMVVEAFGSPDGLYFGTTHSFIAEKQIHIINEKYGLKVDVIDTDSIITGETGFTMDGDHELKFNIDYTSRFEQPNIRVKLYRRKYDETYSLNYEEVDLKDYVTTELVEKGEHEYLVSENPESRSNFTLLLKDNLMTGTYKVAFEIYNNDSYIDSVYAYIFIK